MDKAYDVIVVGAGFAGLASARAAANHGLRVAVIDRQSGPGARVRTTGILVKEAAEMAPVPANLTRAIRRIRLYAPDLRHFDLASPGYYFMVTRTAGLMGWYARRAQAAGVDLIWKRAIRGGARSRWPIIRTPAMRPKRKSNPRPRNSATSFTRPPE